MKKLASQILPICIISKLRKIYKSLRRRQMQHIFIKMYKKDMLRYLKHSRTLGNDNPIKMIGEIILQYHVIEKGLTMPNIRLGFGRERIISLCQECLNYIEKYGQEDDQLKHAIGVLLEYEEYHENNHFILDKDVKSIIGQLKILSKYSIEKTSQIQITNTEYFKHTNCTFQEFSNSRSSVRNFTEEDLPLIKIQKALELASNTPSACNRQSWRTYVFTDKQGIARLLEIQGGNRGFGHLTNKLILITGELGVFCSTNERHQVYTDGGIYAMNLLYALHFKEIASCILNCSFDYKKEEEIKKDFKIKESEVLIAMIACGVAPGEFKIAASPRYCIGKTNQIIN
jgi:nitroreductase